MEHSEGFKNVVATIKALEKQLSLCGDSIRVCEQSAVEAEEEIEEHFAKCMNALAARKASLVRQIPEKVALQSITCFKPKFSFIFTLIV